MQLDNLIKELSVNLNRDTIVHGEMEIHLHYVENSNVKMLILLKVNLIVILKYLDVVSTLILVSHLKTIVIIIMLWVLIIN